MTDYQKKQYEKRYEIDNYVNYRTGARATQIAHRIADTKVNRKLYKDMIDHNFNLTPVENLTENDKVNIGNNPGKVRRLIDLIQNYTSLRLTSQYIDEWIISESYASDTKL